MAEQADWGVVVLDEGDVTFVMCTCGLSVRLSSAYRHEYSGPVADKHASFCDGRPGAHAERQETLRFDPARVPRKKTVKPMV